MQIFEAEQDNLYVEPISAGRVLITSLRTALHAILYPSDLAATNGVASSTSPTSPASPDIFTIRRTVMPWVTALLTPQLLHASTLFGDLLQHSTPTSYQANLFQYFYLSFLLSTEVIQGVVGTSGEMMQVRVELQKLVSALGAAEGVAGAVDTVGVDHAGAPANSAALQHPWITSELAKHTVIEYA